MNSRQLGSFLLAFPFLMLSQVQAQFIQQGSKLVGTGAVGNAQQGESVSLSADGNTAIMGGNRDTNSAGAVWVFTRSGSVWTQQGSKLSGTGAAGNAFQGSSVSLSADGNTAIEGGPGDSVNAGAAWVWTRSGNVWTQQGNKLVGTGAVGKASQGGSVSISADGNTALVGGNADSSFKGAAWVFTRSGNVWTQQGNKLVGTGAVGSFVLQGSSVSLSADGNTAIIGGNGDSSSYGAAWVFHRSGGVWTQQGNKLFGTGAIGKAEQGISVSLSFDGNTAIVGGAWDSANVGAAWVFTRTGSVWTQQGSKLVGTGSVGNTYEGMSVALSSDGDTTIMGGVDDNGGIGAVWMFTRSGGTWTQLGNKLIGSGSVGSLVYQGSSVSLSSDGKTAIEGGYEDNTGVGAAWVFVQEPAQIIDSISIQDGWNMVSVPLSVNDYAPAVLFPTAVSSAFSYDAGYEHQSILKNGTGYWLKFNGGQTVHVTGYPLTNDTIPVNQGWNMIGGLSSAVLTGSIVSNPPGIVTGIFFGYSGGYFMADTIMPGKGYWVRVNQSGSFIMSSGSQTGILPNNRIQIVPTSELPPPPPDGEISNLQPQTPHQFALDQNYPNPFNPSTEVRYQLPDARWVTLKVYNLLGQEVVTLVNEMQDAGYKSVTFDATSANGGLPSGVYTYRLTAGTLTDTKKMILLK